VSSRLEPIPRILLVNPPIYDFSAYDFWLKPYGLLRVGGYLKGKASLSLFDYLDRFHPSNDSKKSRMSDLWGRGKFPDAEIEKPSCFSAVRRRYRRYGLSRLCFKQFLESNGPFDFVLIETGMTYWYPGVREVIEDVRRAFPRARIILGGVYATLCGDHAMELGADFVVKGIDLGPLWEFMGMIPETEALPFWEGYPNLTTGVLKLTDGCPFCCSYCSVPQKYPGFQARSLSQALSELKFLHQRGVRNIAFYDDALLYSPDEILLPFLKSVVESGTKVNFHTPNALNARFLTPLLAERMVRAGFKTFFLGFESDSPEWQKRTGGKVYPKEFVRAVKALCEAGVDRENITAYIIVGHPRGCEQDAERAIRFVHSLGIRSMLAEFSPIPGTPDGEVCRTWANLDEPLWHNKTAFSEILLGEGELNRLKQLSRESNSGNKFPARLNPIA